MVAPGETVADITAEEVVRHEYGHHIAFNRLNAPWTAVDWGPKRWASAANVCARVARREAYPGDEGTNYALNPGEAWAEAYRLMDERKAGDHDRDVADRLAELLPERGGTPGGGADVLQPWTAARTTVSTRVFGKATPKIWLIPLVDAARRRICASARRCRTAERTRSRSSRPTGGRSSGARSGWASA